MIEEFVRSYHDVEVRLVAAAETGLCARLHGTLPSADPIPSGSEPVSVSYTVSAGPSLGGDVPLRYVVSRDGVEMLPSATNDEAFRWLWEDVMRTLAERTRQLVYVQAGVVGWRGMAILISGPSKPANSELVTELVRRGAVYYSDTFAVLDKAGQVHLYLPPAGWPARNEVPARPLRIGLIVAGSHRPGFVWQPGVVRGAGAIRPLFEDVTWEEAERLTEIAGWIASEVVTLHGSWAEAADVAAHLLALVDDALVSHASAALSNGARSLSEDLACVAELRVGSVAPQPARPISRAPAAKRLVAIVTPVHRFPLTADEQISLRHLREYLGHFDRYLIGPHTPPDELSDFATPPFQTRYFADRPGYSRLLMTEQFYRTFADYEYILIYQLDCLVFSDKLEWWCRQGWDYIGAPWFHFWHPHQYANLERSEDPVDRFGTVGNGGFSLRKVESALAVLNSPKRPLRDRLLNRFLSDPRAHEDMFWSYDAPQLMDGFRIPRPRQALAFSFEAAPRFCFHENAERLPFGCHAWTWFEREFWEALLLK